MTHHVPADADLPDVERVAVLIREAPNVIAATSILRHTLAMTVAEARGRNGLAEVFVMERAAAVALEGLRL